jgi:hypothetical protein
LTVRVQEAHHLHWREVRFTGQSSVADGLLHHRVGGVRVAVGVSESICTRHQPDNRGEAVGHAILAWFRRMHEAQRVLIVEQLG